MSISALSQKASHYIKRSELNYFELTAAEMYENKRIKVEIFRATVMKRIAFLIQSSMNVTKAVQCRTTVGNAVIHSKLQQLRQTKQ